jgi:hypothetical protein
MSSIDDILARYAMFVNRRSSHGEVLGAGETRLRSLPLLYRADSAAPVSRMFDLSVFPILEIETNDFCRAFIMAMMAQ